MKHASSKASQLQKSEIVARIPLACSNELAAVEFFEEQRWGKCPACVHCGSVDVYKMIDAKTGERSKRFLWRCHDCHKQFTVRIGMIFEESRLPLRHWCYAFWASCSSKKGISAMQVMRQCQISYKTALFLLHRVRWAMAPAAEQPQLKGIVECDECYVGGKPRNVGKSKRGLGTEKSPVFAMVERGGDIRVRHVPRVNARNLSEHMNKNISPQTRIMTDELNIYRGVARPFASHETVMHSAEEYARGDVTTNTVEGFFSILKRGLHGVYHAVSKEHLHRYLSEFEVHRQSAGAGILRISMVLIFTSSSTSTFRVVALVAGAVAGGAASAYETPLATAR